MFGFQVFGVQYSDGDCSHINKTTLKMSKIGQNVQFLDGIRKLDLTYQMKQFLIFLVRHQSMKQSCFFVCFRRCTTQVCCCSFYRIFTGLTLKEKRMLSRYTGVLNISSKKFFNVSGILYQPLSFITHYNVISMTTSFKSPQKRSLHGLNHLKTRPFKIRAFLSGFQMVFVKVAAICQDFKQSGFWILDPI